LAAVAKVEDGTCRGCVEIGQWVKASLEARQHDRVLGSVEVDNHVIIRRGGVAGYVTKDELIGPAQAGKDVIPSPTLNPVAGVAPDDNVVAVLAESYGGFWVMRPIRRRCALASA
jgi:hypothetical protein